MKTLERTNRMTIGDRLHLLKIKVAEEATKIYEWYNVVCKLQKRFR